MVSAVSRPALHWTHNRFGDTYRADPVISTATNPIGIALCIRPACDLKREFDYLNGPHIGWRWQVYRIVRNKRATPLHSDVVHNTTETGLNEAKARAEAYIVVE